MKIKKLYLVKREVLATSLQQAIRGRGTVYEITTADDKFQPEKPISKIGLKLKKK